MLGITGALLILIIHTQLYGFKYSYLQAIIWVQVTITTKTDNNPK